MAHSNDSRKMPRKPDPPPGAVAIPDKLYFRIGEVCDIAGVEPHVLRYWEQEFPQLTPQKNSAGQRVYRRKDVEIALRIKALREEEGFTIAGAKKRLAAESRSATKLKVVPLERPSESPRPPAEGEDGAPPAPVAAFPDAFSAGAEERSAGTPSERGPEEKALLRILKIELESLLDVLNRPFQA
jgi:DNA-binding transcriptional MerR regulator